MNEDAKTYVAGHRGLAGSAIVRRLQALGFHNLVLRTHAELDLRNQQAVGDFFAAERPEYVFLAAAKVGGIHANDAYPADFIRDNLQIETNVIDAAWKSGARKLQFLSSSCVYPRNAPQPMPESCLLTSELEPTNQWYAIAKIAGLKMCQAYSRQYGFATQTLMPTNLYGPGDNFHLEHSHVLPALLRKFHDAKRAGAKSVTIWGSGTPRREFLYVDDFADAAVFLMQQERADELINVGVGEDVSILELAELVGRVVGFSGAIGLDPSKPDGTPRKLLDVSRLTRLGWKARTPLADGIAATYRWFLDHEHELRL